VKKLFYIASDFTNAYKNINNDREIMRRYDRHQ